MEDELAEEESKRAMMGEDVHIGDENEGVDFDDEDEELGEELGEEDDEGDITNPRKRRRAVSDDEDEEDED